VVAERPMYFGYRTSLTSVRYELATAGDLRLLSPISYQETVGIMYHEADKLDIHNREAHAYSLIPTGGCVEDDNPEARAPGWTPARWGDPYYWVEESRGRGTCSTSAVDVGAKYGCMAFSPVDGVVEIVESYNLYGCYHDQRLTIIPDDHPGMRLVILHLEVDISPGKRVRAGETILGKVRALSRYFRSDVGRMYTGDEGNHVHLQVNRAY
jgi:hypothetical protein